MRSHQPVTSTLLQGYDAAAPVVTDAIKVATPVVEQAIKVSCRLLVQHTARQKS